MGGGTYACVLFRLCLWTEGFGLYACTYNVRSYTYIAFEMYISYKYTHGVYDGYVHCTYVHCIHWFGVA